MVCKRCMSWMELHVELIGWRKCRTCAYCVKEEKKMIKMEELNPKNFKLTPEEQANLSILHEKINKIRNLWAQPMIVTSGFRSKEDHLRIYKEKAYRDNIKFDESKVPMASKHLYGKAVDIADNEGLLAQWCHENIKHLEDIGLWCEDTESTLGWVHFQIEPPKSGNRFFKP